MRPEAVAPVHDRDTRRAIEELCAPVEGRVATADDEYPLTTECLRIGHNVVDPASVPRFGALLGEPPRRKRADPRREHDRARRKAITFRDENEVIAVLL